MSDRVEFTQIECKKNLSPEELQEQASIMASRCQQLEDLESQKKASAASFKERSERISGEIRTAARLHRDGFDMRDIECAVVKDWMSGLVLYIRTDNCEIAREDKMSNAERQMHVDDFLREQGKTDDNIVDAEFEQEAPKQLPLPGKKSGSSSPEKTDEEIRREQEIQRAMRSETTSL